jgi:signal transduction histidine kinase
VDFSGKLITVLTHEIMNSVTPIIALSKVIEETLTEAAAADPARPSAMPAATTDLLRSVASIQARGDGLLRFVQAYRSLTSLPQPNRRRVELASLLEQTVTLLAPAAESARVSLATRSETDPLAIEADAEQIQQVLINLVNNALDALHGRDDGAILLSASRDERHRAVIRVTDNGPGIEAERMDKIFVPFFTTRPRGTGVGLSVSRQIMLLNHGNLTVKSEPGKGAEFSLLFR